MENILIIILASAFVIFGILVFIRPKLGAKIIEAIPWREDDIFNPKLLSVEQKKVSPFIVRLLGVACIFIGFFILKSA